MDSGSDDERDARKKKQPESDSESSIEDDLHPG